MNKQAFNDWMETRPDCIKALAREFPLHTPVWIAALRKTWYVIGWKEDDALIVSPLTLAEDYDTAMTLKQYVCADHYR